MANGANAVHMQLRQALENYIKSQYFGKSPILLSALQGKLDQEGVLYQKPYIEPRLPIRVKKMEYKIPKSCLTG